MEKNDKNSFRYSHTLQFGEIRWLQKLTYVQCSLTNTLFLLLRWAFVRNHLKSMCHFYSVILCDWGKQRSKIWSKLWVWTIKGKFIIYPMKRYFQDNTYKQCFDTSILIHLRDTEWKFLSQMIFNSSSEFGNRCS